jgi:hypothetical protein
MKSKPLEPGCLALIISSYLPENVGKVVRIECLTSSSYIPPGAPFHCNGTSRIGKTVWTVSAKEGDSLRAFVFWPNGQMVEFNTHERSFEAQCLMRINGDPEDVEQYSEIKELEIIE